MAGRFFEEARARTAGPIVCEPRHVTWFEDDADALLARWRIGRVAADPARHPLAATPGGWRGIGYWRLHGSPRMYFFSYDEAALASLARAMREDEADEIWCIFDNTASGAEVPNALALSALIS